MKIFLITAICIISASVYSQKIHVGPEIGMNAIQIEKEDVGKNFQPGWYGGIAFEYDFIDNFGIKTGFYYTQKRQRYTDADTSNILSSLGGLIDLGDSLDLGELDIPLLDLNSYTTTTGRQSQHYFEFPVLAQFKYKGLGVYAGGYFGFMFAARSKETAITNTPITQTIDISSFDSTGFLSFLIPPGTSESFSESSVQQNLRTFDYGIKAGIGYTSNNIGIHAAYQFGIPDYRIDKGNSDLQNHQYFQFSVNYMFPIGKKVGHSSL